MMLGVGFEAAATPTSRTIVIGFDLQSDGSLSSGTSELQHHHYFSNSPYSKYCGSAKLFQNTGTLEYFLIGKTLETLMS